MGQSIGLRAAGFQRLGGLVMVVVMMVMVVRCCGECRSGKHQD